MKLLTTVTAILLTILTSNNLSATAESTCSDAWFDCGNGKCIANIWRCDEDNDCGNMKDEEGCVNGIAPQKCLSSQFQCHSDYHCIPEKWHCDGEHDCDDESDEKDCENNTECTGFRCKDHHCIPQRWKCDGQVDCSDGSDEEACPNAKVCSENEFTCSSGSCISLSKVCDGKKDCLDASDEGKHCSDKCANATCSHLCRATPSGPECYCPTGFKLNKDNRTCSDVDECLEEGLCSHHCENTIGSYECSCLDEYEMVNGTCLAKGSEPLLIFSTLQEIRGMYLRSQRYFLIQKAVYKSAAVDADPSDRRIYWVEISNKSAVYSSKIDGSGFSLVMNHGLLIPEDIAVDYVGRNLYITDSGLKQVLVCKMDGTMCSVLNENMEKPRSLALDPAEGLLYWSDWGDSTAGIYRSGMDGSRPISLVSKDVKWPNGIAIDHTVNRLYWTDAKLHTIEYVTLDGNTRKVLLKELVYHPYSIAVFEDTLYWTDWNTFSLESCNKFTGHKMTLMTRENGKHIMGVHVYHSVLATTKDNPCWSNACSHMCVIAPQKTSRCMCPVGFSLGRDKRTCIMDDKVPSLFVSEDSRMYHIQPEAVGSGAVTEMPVPHLSLIGRVAYDWKSKTLFVSDLGVPAIYAINMTTLIRRELVKSHLEVPQDIAFDWLNNNLYWVDWNTEKVQVVSVSSLKTATVIDHLSKPTAIALSPEKGLLFVSTIGDNPSVTMFDLDGSNPRVLNQIMGQAMSLALHPLKPLLYWADTNAETISYLDYSDSESVPQIRKTVANVLSIAVSEEYLYWTDTKSRQLNLLKENATYSHALSLPGIGSGQVARKVTYSAAPSVSGRSLLGSVDSPCIRNSSICSHICVSSPKGKTCLCPMGMSLANDNTTCTEKCQADEFHCEKSKRCIPTEYVCDGSKDCDDGSDEKNCEEPFFRCPGNDFRCKNGHCIIASWKCDRRNDCGDNSDEEDCAEATSCAKDQFSCENGDCIPNLWRCDGENDCIDGTDETKCHETSCDDESQLRCDHGQCIPRSWVCDGTPDCFDSTDEKNCTQEKKQCTDKEFRCDDGTCIDKSMQCDKRIDCEDGTDERNCTNQNNPCKGGNYLCSDGMCVYSHEVCDGYKDCTGGEDEFNCSFSDCRQDEYLCTASKRCIPKWWVCDGDADCSDGADEVPEKCAGPQKLPPPPVVTADQCDEFFCYSSKECLPWFKICDGTNDCENLPDEGGLCSRECVNNGGCAHICRKSPQGLRCFCYSGYELSPDGKSCEDANECLSPGTCSHFCNNTKGGFKCSCAEGYFLEHHRKCKADGGLGTLVFLLPDEIRGIDMGATKGSRHQRIYVSSSEADMKGMDYDSSGIFFWTDAKEGTISSYTPDSQRQDVIVHTKIKPDLLRWDWIARNLIYTDDEGSIVACREDGKYCSTLIHSAAPYINGIDISPHRGLIFWCVWNAVLHKNYGLIERAEMDGSHRIVIVSDRIIWPTSVTVDHVLNFVYWIDTKLNVLERCDFHGRHRQQVISADMSYPFSMTIFEDRVFWADWGTSRIISCEKFDSSSCHAFHHGNVKSEVIMVVHKVKQTKGENRCKDNKCQHICLPTRSSFVCKCGMGYAMKNSTCEQNETGAISFTPKPRESCPENYCLHDARCVVVGGKYHCWCPYPYDGDKCEVQIAGTATGPDYSWIVAVFLAIIVVGGIILAVMMCRRNREKLSKVTESVAVKFRNPIFRRKSGRLVVDTDDGGACDELMLGKNGAYKQSGFGNPLFGKKPVKFDPEAQEGDFKRWPSYDSDDSAFASENQTREGSQLCIDETPLTNIKTSEKIVQFFKNM